MSYFLVLVKAARQALKEKGVVVASLLLLTISTQVYADCTVAGTSYRTNYDTSGTYITLSNLTSRASSWNNTTDLVTTCDVSQFTSMLQAFYGNSAFNQDLSAWDTSAVTNMDSMFRGATSLTSVSLPDTSKVTTMYRMFMDASSLTSVTLPKTGDVTIMARMFYRASSLTSVSLSDTSAVTNMDSMYREASSLTSVSLPDTSKVTTMSRMFSDATSLTSVTLPKTGDVTIMARMFWGATSLTSVSLSDTSKVTDMRAMFYQASSLTSVSLPNTSAVTDMAYMFMDASNFAQDIRSWNVDNVLSFVDMFNGASAMIATYSSTPNWNTTPTAAWFTPDTTTTANAPTALVATAGDGQVSIAFTAPSNNGGAAITYYEYELDDSGTWTSASTAATPVVITGLTNGTAYSIKLRAVNSAGKGAESDAVSVLLGSPASEFAAKEASIRSVIINDAQRSLNSTLASNTRLTRDARGRFLTSREQMQSDGTGLASRNTIALDVDGIAVATPEQMSTQGMFFAQTGNFEGTQRRLVFGDFDVQRDGDTGSTTATINGKVAWEQMLSEQTMLGYYLGGEVARSNIRGSFKGTQDKYGVSVGGYFVHALQENLFVDGFASLGAGRNNLEMADDTLDLTSNYTTQTVTLGAAVSGIIEQAGFNILPELSVAYGRTSIGNVGFTGVAYGLTDDTLSLEAGSVSTATIMFRPEFRVSLDGLAASESRSVFSFAPRVMCERVKVASTTNNCGSGAELGISSSSSDGLTSLNASIIADRVGNSTRRSLQLNLQHKF